MALSVSANQITGESPADEQPELVAPRRTRIDEGHTLRQPCEAAPEVSNPMAAGRELLEVIEGPADEMAAAALGENLEIRREQLQLQVSQLAGHLRERLREVDRREAQLHAREAHVESEARASRLWLNEREQEYRQRETELRRRIEELEERLTPRPADAGEAHEDTEARERDLADREQLLAHRENELRERRHESDRQAAALRHAQQLWEQQREQEERDLADQRADLAREFQTLVAEREAQLRAAEQLVLDQSQQLDADRSAVLAERRAWDEQQARQRQALDEARRAADAEIAERRQRLEDRQEWLERQKATLEQVRGEIVALHRQSLEMRLLAEQLWSQIAGRLPSVEVTHSIAQLRMKLADQYKLEEANLASRREELLELGERITQRHRELTQLRSGLREWAAARQSDIAGQAAALVRREAELDQQQERLRQAEQDWSAARRGYEQQIRDLTTQLRALPAAA